MRRAWACSFFKSMMYNDKLESVHLYDTALIGAFEVGCRLVCLIPAAMGEKAFSLLSVRPGSVSLKMYCAAAGV